MAYPPTAQPHGHCTYQACVEWLGLLPTAEDGSANATGRAAELLVLHKLQACGITASHQPRASWVSPDDKGIRPDYALWIPSDGDDEEGTLNYGAVFALGELKLQRSKGSAYQKVEHSIRRYAHLSDEHNAPAVIIHMICPAIAGAGTLDELEVIAAHHGVGWIGFDDITAERVAQVITDVARARRKRIARARMHELIAELGPEGVGELFRYSMSTDLTRRREEALSTALASGPDQEDLFGPHEEALEVA